MGYRLMILCKPSPKVGKNHYLAEIRQDLSQTTEFHVLDPIDLPIRRTKSPKA
jgi:hypothetical protein